ncbi:LOW QUALITY PROTEIN: HET domain-containingprotein [Purpureocillium lavendulum]|uniref:HET domain-containingprotein n=1 Tax=Purpureocillium lavendulum TaxID=1247861 RepID=A0AB34FRY9_9HYPO|nr:LOW QUALITY PROTEIN: HET domain-containingprotein [Purpureocillium lavendulum]
MWRLRLLVAAGFPSLDEGPAGMDLFCLPDDPAAPTPPCPYVCAERWDGGPFRSYAVRKGRAGLVPTALRDTPGAEVAPDVFYAEPMYPTPRAELEPFLQTWLFFGLVAEMLGLNETAPGQRRGLGVVADEETARAEIAALHDTLLVRDGRDDDDDDGEGGDGGNGESVGGPPSGKVLTGAVLVQASLADVLHQRLAVAPDHEAAASAHLAHLGESLRYAVTTLHSIQENVSDPVRHSIAALGELLSTALFMAVARTRPRIPSTPAMLSANWYRDYVRRGGAVEAGMLARGWCPSEVDKIRAQFQGVFTMHYVSRLRRRRRAHDQQEEDAENEGLEQQQQQDGGHVHAHGGCTVHACRAFQMDVETYQPSHARDGCACAHVEVPEADIIRVLRETDSFPVLRVASGEDDRARLAVEAWTPDMPYVAFSHVWADGLGNPHRTSLPGCQVERICQLVAALQQVVRSSSSSAAASASSSSPPTATPPYRIWIDTFCCPVEPAAKPLALGRIAAVYRQATHVLVLDKALAAFPSAGTHPAELLLRTVGASPWMRRLWTLQEGALAQSLFVQFADRAVDFLVLLQDLYAIASRDARYMRIWQDVMTEFNLLQSLSPKRNGAGTVLFSRTPAELITVQRALHFRSVSVPADEPLCIATLLGLDARRVAEASSHQHRMVRVWEQIAGMPGTGNSNSSSSGDGNDNDNGDGAVTTVQGQQRQGGISVRVLFFLEEPLDVPGWRWAPRTLLGSSVRDPVIGIDERVLRFLKEDDVPGSVGTPAPPLGLRVTLRGCRLAPRPRAPGLPLDPWPGLIRKHEDQVLVRRPHDGRGGGWVRVMDWYRTRKIDAWTKEERLAHDERAAQPLQRAMATGRCALLYDVQTHAGELRACCLVQEVRDEADDDDDGARDDDSTALGSRSTPEAAAVAMDMSPPPPPPLRVRRERTVLMSPLSDAEARMMDVMQDLADRVAADPATRDLLALGPAPAPDADADKDGKARKDRDEDKQDQGGGGEAVDDAWKTAWKRVGDLMKRLVAEALASHPDVAQTARDYLGPDADEYLWVLIPKAHAHTVTMTEVPEGQVLVPVARHEDAVLDAHAADGVVALEDVGVDEARVHGVVEEVALELLPLAGPRRRLASLLGGAVLAHADDVAGRHHGALPTAEAKALRGGGGDGQRARDVVDLEADVVVGEEGGDGAGGEDGVAVAAQDAEAQQAVDGHILGEHVQAVEPGAGRDAGDAPVLHALDDGVNSSGTRRPGAAGERQGARHVAGVGAPLAASVEHHGFLADERLVVGAVVQRRAVLACAGDDGVGHVTGAAGGADGGKDGFDVALARQAPQQLGDLAVASAGHGVGAPHHGHLVVGLDDAGAVHGRPQPRDVEPVDGEACAGHHRGRRRLVTVQGKDGAVAVRGGPACQLVVVAGLVDVVAAHALGGRGLGAVPEHLARLDVGNPEDEAVSGHVKKLSIVSEWCHLRIVDVVAAKNEEQTDYRRWRNGCGWSESSRSRSGMPGR